MFRKTVRILLLLILFMWGSGYGLFVYHVSTLKPQNPSEKTDAIVVLTGGNHRVDTGLFLLSEGAAPQLFISGVHDAVTENEIRAMWTKMPALPACCITLGRTATTTFENAQETQIWAQANQIRSIRLVTSAYHMNRAVLEFRRVLGPIKILIHPVPQPDDVLFFWKITFKEYNKTLYRAVMVSLEKWGATS